VSQINNDDDVHQGLETVSGDKDIHSLLNVARKKVGDFLLNMCSTFQKIICDNIPKCIVGCCMFTSARAKKQMAT
jgi:hypothetical protein